MTLGGYLAAVAATHLTSAVPQAAQSTYDESGVPSGGRLRLRAVPLGVAADAKVRVKPVPHAGTSRWWWWDSPARGVCAPSEPKRLA